ncbi:hypothetical protein OSTOST_25714 [Ostertagia ostertagi]
MGDLAAAFANAELTPSVIDNPPKQNSPGMVSRSNLEMTMSDKESEKCPSFSSPRSGPGEHLLPTDDRSRQSIEEKPIGRGMATLASV